jgi:four helix bundle protein
MVFVILATGGAVQDFRNLEVWRMAHELTLGVYKSTACFPPDERFGLTSQLRRACSSIEANLAEGCGRGSDADFSRFVQIAMGSASEVEFHLLLARDLGYMDDDLHVASEQQVQRVKRMLAALLKSLKKTEPYSSGRRPIVDSR